MRFQRKEKHKINSVILRSFSIEEYMINKTLIILLLLLPVYVHAGFYVKRVAYSSGIVISSGQEQDTTTVRRHSIIAGHKNAKKPLPVLAFLLGIAGLGAVGVLIALWSTSVIGVYIAASLILVFGIPALILGYASVVSDKHTVLGTIGYALGIIESLPVILVGSLIFSIISIGGFVFRKRKKKKA